MTPITQDNLYLLLPSKVCWLVDMLLENNKLSIIEAIRKVYSSNVYKKLEIEKNKLWHAGPVELFEEMEAAK